MKKLSVLIAGVAILATLATAAEASAVITIVSVSNNGRTITIKGKTALVHASGLVRQKLVADAGDAVFVGAGDIASLLGDARGGVAPYKFKWTSPVGTLDGANAPTALLNTKGVKASIQLIRLTVTDAVGATASDTVKAVLYGGAQKTLLKANKNDPTPGVTGTGTVQFKFNVPAGTERFDARVTWDNPQNDYDLTMIAPDGSTQTGSGGSFGEPETGTVAKPMAGQWTLSMDKFVTVGDTLHALVIGLTQPNDPRPVVDAGGPYRFLIGETQKLKAKITGGTEAVKVGWDTDDNGVIDTMGSAVTLHLNEGRHLVTVRAVDANGLERRQTTSVLVATKERLKLDTTAITVIGISDTGVNPYNLEYSATTYPDPDVLALTKNFTRPPSEYIPGYPADAQALPITLGHGYLPPQDKHIWDHNKVIQPGKLYWIPGTKIIGAIASSEASGGDPHPILDDEGHGSGTTSVSTGNRYGYCPTCLLVIVEGLNVGIKEAFPWVDISSNSFGPSLGLPTALTGAVLAGSGPDIASKKAVERGQIDLFAAGNGLGNFFDVPQADWGESYTGMPWNITVGAIRRDNHRAIVGDGIPVHVSAWGDGDLPSVCRTGEVSQCAFGGTSAATPYTAGVFGTVLTQIRRELGDGRAGQRPHQVIAEGIAIPGSPYLSDGKLTRQELRDVVLKTTEPLNQSNDVPDLYPHPVWAPYIPEANVLFEGYGAATPDSAQRAIDVLMGRAPLPDRSFEDTFFQIDNMVKTTLYGTYDTNGDGQPDAVSRPAGFHVNRWEVTTQAGELKVMARALRAMANQNARAASADPQPQASETFSAVASPVSAAPKPMNLWLHRIWGDPDATPTDDTPGLLPSVPPALGVFIPSTTTVRCTEASNDLYMDETNSKGDLDPCFNARVSSVIANFRPVQAWPLTHGLTAPLPAGSNVHIELYMSSETPQIVDPTGVLVATDREIGIGAAGPALQLPAGINGSLCDALGDACWTKYDFSFHTTRPAFRGEQIAFQIQLLGARSWAFGYEGNHASKITITPAAMPPTGLSFGVSILPGAGANVGQKALLGGRVTFPDLGADPYGAGDHPQTRTVQVSIDDPNFADPVLADVDMKTGTWSIDLGRRISAGAHTIYVRAAIDRTYSNVASTTLGVLGNTVVQYQVTRAGALPVASAWHTISGLANWTFSLPASTAGVVHIRVLSAGVEVAQTTVSAQGSGGSPLPATGVGGAAQAATLLAIAVALAWWMKREREAITG